jgi:hypothetical protein
LAIPAVSASGTANNNLIADASVVVNPSQSATAELMVFYGAPQVPQVKIGEPIQVPGPVSLYAAPQIPDINSGYVVNPPMVFYGAPQTPVTPAVQVVNPPMVFYGAPQIPEVPVNVIEKQVVPMPVPSPEQMQSLPSVNDSSFNNTNGIQGTSSGTAAQSSGIKANTAKGAVEISPYSKTNDFVFSEYGNVKIVEPFAHFIFR